MDFSTGSGQTKTRLCNVCGEPFLSMHFGHRTCDVCHGKTADRVMDDRDLDVFRTAWAYKQQGRRINRSAEREARDIQGGD